MKSRLCYAWFGEFADAPTGDAGASPCRPEVPSLPPSQRRTIFTHDGHKWSVKHEPASAPTSPEMPTPRSAA